MGVPLVWSALSGKPSSPWLWSRPIDLLVIAGAGSMVFMVLAIPASYLWAGFGAAMITVFFHLSVVCNGPHYAATYQIVIRERHRRRRNWMWLAVTAPAVLAALMAVGFWPTVLLAPFTRLYLTLSPHHYAAQHFGMAALYSARRGRPLDPGVKRLLRFSFLGIGGFMMLMANTLVAESNEGLVGIPASRYVAQGGLPPFTYYIGLGLVAVSLGLVWLADRRLRRRTRRGMDGIVWLLFFVNFLWFWCPTSASPGTPTRGCPRCWGRR